MFHPSQGNLLTAPAPPKWLEEIREYWSQMTAQLTDETGRPSLTAPEPGFSPAPDSPGPKFPALRLPSSPPD